MAICFLQKREVPVAFLGLVHLGVSFRVLVPCGAGRWNQCGIYLGAVNNVMGQKVKPEWGQSDKEAGHQARCADRSLTCECHQGQQGEHPAPTGRM